MSHDQALTRTPVSDEHRALAADAARRRVHIASVEWAPIAELAFAEWREQGHRLAMIARGSQWWLGDWLNYGESAYGEKYAQATEITGFDVGTLMNFAWVASTFEVSRRREGVSWSHHYELAGQQADLADELLDAAQAGHWSRNRLRAEVRRRAHAVTSAQISADSCSRSSSATPTPARATLELELEFDVACEAEGRRELAQRLELMGERAAELGLRVAHIGA